MRPCALAADIDDVRPSRGHCEAGRDRGFPIEEVAAVAETVRRYVEHAHDTRAVEAETSPLIHRLLSPPAKD